MKSTLSVQVYGFAEGFRVALAWLDAVAAAMGMVAQLEYLKE